MEFVKRMTRFQVALAAIIIGFVVAYMYYNVASSVTDIVQDAQSGIVVFYAAIIGAFLWALLSFSIYYLIRGYQQRYWFKTIGFALIALAVIGFTINTAIVAINSNNLLRQAADATTSPQRLRDLVDAEIGMGYELHNRIASNPSTPADVLESLYGIEGQIGTDIVLARNPNTPNHILTKLSQRQDSKWREQIISALKRNPKVKGNVLHFNRAMTLEETEPSNNP